jgi:hypothetical protein
MVTTARRPALSTADISARSLPELFLRRKAATGRRSTFHDHRRWIWEPGTGEQGVQS